MKKIKISLLTALIVSGFQANTTVAFDKTAVQSAINTGISELEMRQNITEGGWGDAEGLDYIYSASAIEALRATNQKTGTYYSGIAWLENHHANNNDLEARKIMALASRGNNIDPDLAILQAAKRHNTQAGWGLSKGYYHSPLESALVLQAFHSASEGVNQAAAVDYLLQSQNTDGGWSTEEDASSNNWITAEVVLALVNQKRHANVASAITKAGNYLAKVNYQSISSITLARIALALHHAGGHPIELDKQITALLNKQQSNGNWGNILATANAVTVLAHVLGINPDGNEERITFDDEQLRVAVNMALGKEAYSHITQADLNRLKSLDIRNINISSLNGLQRAANLTSLKVRGSTNIASFSGITGVNLLVDTDSDNIAENKDNCPTRSNNDQADLDRDGIGDACDNDIDNDGMPNYWEDRYRLKKRYAADAKNDNDKDKLTNLKEYQIGTNPLMADTDWDKLADGYEITNGFDPLNRFDPEDANDFDKDGLSNVDEDKWKSDPKNPDTDNDNMEDGDEVKAGRSPVLNEPAILSIISGLLLN